MGFCAPGDRLDVLGVLRGVLGVTWDGRLDGRMDGFVGGWIGQWMDGWVGGRTDGQMDGWMDGCISPHSLLPHRPCREVPAEVLVWSARSQQCMCMDKPNGVPQAV